MAGTSTASTPNICLTLLDPPESTLHPPPRHRPKGDPGFTSAETTGDFRLVGEVNRVPPRQPATDPTDPSLPLEPVAARSVRPSNANAGIRFRHHTWHHNRAHVLEALNPNPPDPRGWIAYAIDPSLPEPEPAELPSERARRFADCGSRSVVLQHADDPTRYKIACQRCHDRFCLPCMQDRARLIIANLKAQVPYAPTRFLTLTLKHADVPLTEQIDRLYTSFGCLRRRQFWRDTVTGGIAFLEIKLSKRDALWHPHLHVMVRGDYVPNTLISDAWLQITGDSFIIDIRLVKSPDKLYSYLARYVTKGWDTGIYRTRHGLREAIQALAGRKILSSFGDFARLRLLLPPTSETWVELGTLHEIQILAVREVPWAVAAFASITSRDYEPPLCVEPPNP